MSESYRHYVPTLCVSLEKNTERVPNDDKYHLVHDGEIVASFSSLKRGESRFRQLLAESGHEPQRLPGGTIDAAKLDVERYLDAKEEYWGSSHKYRSRGGKLGNR